ncbi:MAG: cyclase family protein [Gammaproteobacteria bacterium]
MRMQPPKQLFLIVLMTLSTFIHASDEQSRDDRGALERLTPSIVLAAADLIRSGKVYSLAIPTTPDTPAWTGRSYQMLTDRILINGESTYGRNRLQGFDDFACIWLGIGTQIDGFAHVAVDGRHYHGLPSSEVITPRGAKRYGVEQIDPLVGRGVLLDLTMINDGQALAAGHAIGSRELRKVAARQNVTIESGDVILLHTGWLPMAGKDPQRFMQTEPGLSLDGAKYLAGRGVAAIGADNHSLEVYPAENEEDFLPVHGYLLVNEGIHILENIVTQQLAADRAYTFFFVLAPPRLSGAVQTPVHPVAIR